MNGETSGVDFDRLADSFVARIRRGERPSLSEYVERYPQFADEVMDLFPALAEMEGLKPDPNNATGSFVARPSSGDGAPIPEQMGDYRILRLIGQGGMGVVYEARRESLSAHVALKVLHHRFRADDGFLRRFRNEARSAARLHHTNIVPVFDFGEHDGIVYYVMQYIPGQGLDRVMADVRRLREGEPSPPPAVGDTSAQLARSVARGLLTGEFIVEEEGPTSTKDQAGNEFPICGVAGAKVLRAPVRGPTEDRGTEYLSPGHPSTKPGTYFGPAPKPVVQPDLATTTIAEPQAPTPPEESGRISALGGASTGQGLARYHREVARIGAQVADALAHAHALGVLHRDIKPPNLLLDARGNAWVTDFGLAKCEEAGEADLTGPGDVPGTLRYMAPERLSGQSDRRGDIYALGVTLYEMIALRPAYDERDKPRLVRQILHDEPPPLRKLDPRVPRDLETIIHKAMAKDIAARYQKASELAEDLRLFLEDRPIGARRSTSIERSWRWCRRNPVIATLSAVAVLTLLSGTAISSYFAFRAYAEKGRADNNALTATTKANEAIANADKARTEKDRADAKTDEFRRNLYDSHMNLAQVAWDDAHMARILDLLKQHEPQPGEEDLRGFEWYYWNRQAHSYQRNLEGHTDLVASVAFSADGKRLASGSGDKTVKVWDATTGQQTLTLKGHTGLVNSVAYSPDGKRLVSASWDKTLKVWDTKTGQDTLTLSGHTGIVRSVAFSPDGKRLASASDDTTVRVWDATTGQQTLTLKSHTKEVFAVAYSADGKRLASASDDQTVKLWDATTGQETLTLKGHTGGVWSVALSGDGKRVASGSMDRTVKIWDATTGQAMLTLRGHTNTVMSAAFSADGKCLATAGHDQTVKVWDAATGQDTLTLRGHTDAVFSVAFSADGKRLASASQDKTVKVWDARTGQEARTLKGHTDPVSCVAFSPDGKRLASASWDKTVKMWDLTTGLEMLSLTGHTGWVTCVAFNPDGKQLASASNDGTVKVWDTKTGQETLTLKAHTGIVRGVAFSPDGKRLASASDDTTVKVWDTKTGQQTLTLNGHARAVNDVAFSPDGKRLATASHDKTVRVWDTTTGQETLTLKAHTGTVWSVAFSPDGKRLATASHDKTVKVWDTKTGQETLTLNGHTNWVYIVAFSPDGKRLASASQDGTVKVWDAATGQETLTLNGHTNAVTDMAFSPDGKRLASANFDGTVKVLDARPWTPELRVEEEALSVVRFYSTPPISTDALQARIRADATISEPVRKQALEFARQWPEPKR